MQKTLGLAVAVALGFAASQQAVGERPALLLKEEQIIVEYTATAGEATIIVVAESEESLGHIEALTPDGLPIMRIHAGSQGRFPLQGFLLEGRESSLKELRRRYAAGPYELRALTTDGVPMVGSAVLSHDLRPVPVVTYPRDGDMAVSATLTVTWQPDPGASAYQVVLEQGDSDTLTVELPRSATSFAVPAGVLRSGEESHVEVGAYAPNGNRTLVEVSFTTL